MISQGNLIESYGAKYFYMFMMFIWMGRTTPLTGFNFTNNPILMPIYLLILLVYFKKYCNYPNLPLRIIVFMYAFWYLILCLKFGGMQEISFQFLYYLLIAHIALNLYDKHSFMLLFEKVLVKLCVISLIVWGLANLFPNWFPAFMHTISVMERRDPTETNSIIVGMGTSFELGLRRNIGFTWEPGVFSCFVQLGLFINLIRSRFCIAFRKNINFYILLLTLFSTLSTTGYATFAIIVLFYLINTSVLSKVIVSSLAIALIPTIIGLSFMSQKIIHLMDIDNEINAMNYYMANGYAGTTPQRFSGMYFEFQNLIHDFWFGYGNPKNSYVQTTMFPGFELITSGGVVNVLSRYGVIFGGFLYLCLYKTTIFLSKSFQYKGTYIFAILFLTISISYDFWENCFLMYLYLFTFYKKVSPSYNNRWENIN